MTVARCLAYWLWYDAIGLMLCSMQISHRYDYWMENGKIVGKCQRCKEPWPMGRPVAK